MALSSFAPTRYNIHTVHVTINQALKISKAHPENEISERAILDSQEAGTEGSWIMLSTTSLKYLQ